MNRPGQQPQRPPNLGPTPNMGGFRGGPYQQAYGLPPRGVMQGYPNLQNHRAQSLVPQASPGFIQQRTVGGSAASGFSFGGSMQQQQQQAAAVAAQQSSQQQHQQHQQAALQQQQSQPHPQPQSQNSTSGTVPPHLAQQQGAPGGQNSGEVGLDPNDFPALGSANTPGTANSTSASNANLHSSYATQAGTGVPPSSANPGATQGPAVGQPARDFGPDDFPALSGQAQQQGTPQSQDATATTQQQQHPPGINGFQQQAEQSQSVAQQHRQTLLGSMAGQQQSLLGQQQARGLHAGYDAEKRNNFAKLNQNWNSSSAQNAPAFPPNLTNGAQSQQHLLQQTQTQQSAQQTQHLNAPPGVPPPSTYAHQQQYPAPAGQNADAHHPHPPSQQTGTVTAAAHPQTPAQQLLMSPADRWGLLGLLALIKSADPDMALLSVGADLANLGLNVGQEGNIYSNFITPWSDSAAAASVEPEFHLPACYNVQPPPPGPTKAAAFSDETLFFMFYSSPRDALQEVAAQELWNRNWRWHKELRHWLTKETGTSPSQKVPGGEAGTYTFWDPESWTKERKELTVLYTDLEEKSMPAFVQGPGLQPHPQGQPGGMNVAVGTQMGMQNVGGLPHVQRGGYQGMGIVAGMA